MIESTSDRWRRVAWWCFLGGVAVYLLLSAPALSALGVAYDEPGGSPLAKFHPGSWAIAVACGLALASYGHPMRVAGAFLAAHPLLAGYGACQLFVFAWVVGWHGTSGAANVVDSLLMPFVAVTTLLLFDAGRRHRCLVLIVALLVVNTLIGLGEGVLHRRVVPLAVGGFALVEEHFRSGALLGHPLTGSMLLATLLPGALFLRIGAAWRGALALLLWVGVLAFGGRTAFVLSTLAYGLWLVAALVRALALGRFGYARLTGGALLAVLGALALAAAIAASGIGERVFANLFWDGSAAVRVRIWEVLDYLDTSDLIVGVDPDDLPRLDERLGLARGEAIENFWLVMLLRLGWGGFVPFAVGMACAFAWAWRSSPGVLRVAIGVFLAVASSNNSLATKTVALVLFLLLVAAVRRPAAARRAGRVRPSRPSRPERP